MNAFPSSGGGHGALHLVPDGSSVGVSEFLAPAASAGTNKRKRRPAGTPDPDAEVVALSPKTLMESDRYVCEICNQGFQRDQNLQMHRRRHKVPWKLLKRPNLGTNKRVYICPERSCLHHDPAHALGDLVGIKKHYRRKHCTEKQWKCDKCSKGYAVQSDYKAHLKTCGTRGHCCDCGRVFSRVESFIEHQDTCSAVKRKATQSSGGGSERMKSSIPHHGTDRHSNESPSQSSDTTQAMSFSQSRMSDTTARSVDINTSKVRDEHSRRIQENQAAIPSAMPAWLTERRNELELLPTMQRVPTDRAHSDHFLLQEVRARVDQASHGSQSQVSRCSPTFNHPYREVTCPEKKVILEPSLQLSIGPTCGAEVASSSPSSYTNIKPSFSNSTAEREALALTYHQKQFPSVGIIERLENCSRRTATVGFDSMALSIPATLAQSENHPIEGRPGSDHAVSLSGFLMRAARRPPGPGSQAESSAGRLHQSTKKDENKKLTEMVSNYNPACAGSTSSYHENRSGNMHESDPAPGTRATRRAFTNSQLEPATSSVIYTSRQALNLDVAETDHLFAANSKSVDEAFRSQKQYMAAAARAKTDRQDCEQTQADMNATWSDLARVRRTTDEARQECDEAQRELARAEILKRQAREQLQFASSEKAYADRAREAAKRQIEISEAELANAKRLREHAQAELEEAGSQKFSRPTFCHSCKSAIETIPSRRSPPTSPGSWSMMTPSASTEQLEAGTRRSTGAGQILFMNSGSSLHELGARHADQATDSNKSSSANRMPWSESLRTPMSGFNHSGELWPSGYRSMSTLATTMAIGESPPSGDNPLVAVRESIQVSSPAQSDRRDQITPKDLDLN